MFAMEMLGFDVPTLDPVTMTVWPVRSTFGSGRELKSCLERNAAMEAIFGG
jgi:hypothetical protein